MRERYVIIGARKILRHQVMVESDLGSLYRFAAMPPLLEYRVRIVWHLPSNARSLCPRGRKQLHPERKMRRGRQPLVDVRYKRLTVLLQRHGECAAALTHHRSTAVNGRLPYWLTGHTVKKQCPLQLARWIAADTVVGRASCAGGVP
jgi:hypothetical protein